MSGFACGTRFPLKFLTMATLCAVVVSVGLGGPVRSQEAEAEPAAPPEPQPLFASHDLLVLTIEGPMRKLSFDNTGESEEMPGTVSFAAADGSRTVLNVALKTRGLTRRKKDICRFPPLRVNFKTKQAKGTVFEGQDKLKLVTHCQHRNTTYEQYYIQEYLLYRVYNLITDLSFKVRPATITYIDSDTGKTRDTRFGFFIEDQDAMAARNGLKAIRLPKLSSSWLNPDAANMIAVFEFMAGNLDWSATRGPRGDNCCHNSKIMGLGERDLIPVPYDFDFSGVVSAEYATPPPKLGLRNVKQRLYRGYCKYMDGLAVAFKRFQDQKSAIYAVYEGDGSLRKSGKRKTLRYFDSFYGIIGNPAKVKRMFEKKCR